MVYQPEGVHAEALHHAVAARQGPVRHQPHDGVQGLGLQGHEVPQRVVRRLGLRNLVVRFGFHRVHEVGELDAVLNEEHREVVAHQVVIALFGIELGGEAAYVSHGVGRSARAGDRGEPNEHRRLDTRAGQKFRRRVVRQPVVVGLEIAVGAGAARVHHALRDAFMVEVGDLLPGMKVLQQGGTPLADGQRIVGVVDADALLSGEVTGIATEPGRLQIALFGILVGGHAGGVTTGQPGANGHECAAIQLRPDYLASMGVVESGDSHGRGRRPARRGRDRCIGRHSRLCCDRWQCRSPPATGVINHHGVLR